MAPLAVDAAAGAARPVLVAPKKAAVGTSIVFTGSTGTPKRAKVTLEQRKGSAWRARTRGRAVKGGAFRLTWKHGKPGKAVLRIAARAGGRTLRSRPARVRFSSDPSLRTTAPVLTPKAGSVRSAPAPGAAAVVLEPTA